jgi:hypothetical protein
MTDVPKREDFETAYAGRAPWEIGRPQKAFVDIVFSDNYSSLQRQLDFPAQRQLLAPTTITAVG